MAAWAKPLPVPIAMPAGHITVAICTPAIVLISPVNFILQDIIKLYNNFAIDLMWDVLPAKGEIIIHLDLGSAQKLDATTRFIVVIKLTPKRWIGADPDSAHLVPSCLRAQTACHLPHPAEPEEPPLQHDREQKVSATKQYVQAPRLSTADFTGGVIERAVTS
jgi:hypothetical protein